MELVFVSEIGKRGERESGNAQPRRGVREHEVRCETGKVLRTERPPERARRALRAETPDPPRGDNGRGKVQSSVRSESEQVERV